MRAKRFRIALAVLLVVALSPLAGVFAFGAGENATGGGAASAFGGEGGSGATAVAAGSATAVADDNTASTWRDWGLENSTENVGRIWTDKTVQAGDITLTGAGGEKTIPKGSSTFLTALSAISSTSNLKSTATTPLDIVLVLDASGSMSDPMGRTDPTERIEALKDAANSFVDEIAKQNEGVTDATKQHQVAIVKFAGDESYRVGNDMYRDGQNTYNYSQVMKAMVACTNDTAASFKETVNSIKPAGATRADNGMKRAQSQTSNRSDAKKIVVFFTDGVPTSFSDFDPSVASAAIDASKAMKDAGASVYTIGIFSGANPNADVAANGTSNENKFMQAASSNYPDATYTKVSWGKYDWNFGTRAENSDFYKSATNADELKKVFEDISKEIVSGTGYPTDTTEGFEADSGFIAFTDQLGDYMKVDGFTSIVFANQVFENPTKTTNGLVDIYTFTGEAGNALYPKGNLKDIDITVTRSDDLKTGDKVEVKIPAALIPLRNFQINEDGTGSVDLTFPIRAFYGSSLKDGVVDELANPGSELAAYIAGNSADGKVDFLANKWNGGADGDVIANFTPSKGNSYYYITEDTPIYQDEACMQRANAPLEQDKTYYYQRTWYDISNGKATQQTKTVSFDSGVVENINGYIASDNGKAYFKAGTPRMTYINELNTAKKENVTQTANTFINPKWAGDQVNVLLGNNGKLSVKQPGTLVISKTVEVPDGYNADEYANDSFGFAISIPSAANAMLKAQVKNAAGETVGDAFDIAFEGSGNATHSLKSGETLHIYGLADGATYTVTETPKAGFTQTAPVDQAGKATAASGTIEAGKTSNADFTNKYAATGTLNGETALAGEKVLTGRDWLASDEFTFLLKDANTSVEAPMPEGASGGEARMEVTQSEGTPADTRVLFHFGNIVYAQPGTYVYEIWESEELSVINPGVSASQALYRVTVKVIDESHNGQLSVESIMEKIAGDNGEVLESSQVVQRAAFVNEYDTQVVKWNPSGTKNYTDSTGANPLKQGMFNVAACAKGDAPLPQDTGAETVECVIDGETWHGVITTVEEGGSVSFPQAVYESALEGRTFEYKIVEVVKDVDGKWVAVKDALPAPDYASDGMKYDPSVWTVQVSLHKNEDDILVLSAKYLKDGIEQQGSMFAFANSYNPTPATATIEGSKTLTGRDMAEGETFGFTLSAADKATQDAIDAGAVKLPANTTALVSGSKNDEAKNFSFEGVSFSKPGTYSFNVNETQWNGGALPVDGTGGLTFDRSAKTVTVAVTDSRDGTLKAETAYPEGGAAFVNQYDSSAMFAGIQVSKTLVGRNMAAGEFAFDIEGADDASKALLADADKSFTNENPRMAGEEDVMMKLAGHVFTLNDAGTYTFTVFEKQGDLSGVTYDGAMHKVEIVVADNGDGTMRVVTKVDGVEGTKVSFKNVYEAGPVSFDTVNAQLIKVLEGRDWIDSDEFAFTVEPVGGAPMPTGFSGTVTVTASGAKNGERVPFDFGNIEFTSDMMQGAQTRTFTYVVREVVPDDAHKLPGVSYSTNVATIKVTVTDDGTGQLKASAATENGVFVNRYAAEIDYAAAGGLKVAKTLTGRDMAEGQFEIRVTPGDEASANALGLPLDGRVISVPAAADGQQVVKSVLDGQSVVFRQNDVGKTYTYKVAELGEAPSGYTYDTVERTVTITVADNPEQGALTVTTVVLGGPEGAQTFTYGVGAAAEPVAAVVPFANSYAASTDEPGGVAASVSATKVLTGRPLGAEEFAFAVKYAVGDGDDVLQAVNAADGTVTFGELHYSTDKLADLVKDGRATRGMVDDKPVWIVQYVAYEMTTGLSMVGITPQTQPIPFTVTVVDNGNGTLTATANVGEGLVFENAYATDGPVKVGLAGVKMLVAGPDLTPGDITGKFTFAVTSDDPAAPMPEHTSVMNAANGSVDFGDITFTLDDLNRALGAVETQAVDDELAKAGAAAEEAGANELAVQAAVPVTKPAEPRSHTFVYEITESGSAAGVTNDAAASKTVSFKVTDDGSGKLTVERVGDAEAPAFAFANTYSVEPVSSSVTDQLGVSKTLTGRDMAAGEFTFELLEGERVVATGVNDADGNVVLSGITYTKPGNHHYTMREVGGGTTAQGVTYDGATFAVTTTVVDNGNGTLGVTHRFDSGQNAVFANTYNPADAYVTVGASKTLLGKDLVDGQFTFLLTAHDGTVVQAKNAADGTVTFPKLRFTQPGTYEYTLSELNDAQANVKYDKRTYHVTITVADDLQGHLVATLTSGDEALTFTNEYVEPPAPEQPGKPAVPSVQPGPTPQPAGKVMVQTGDSKALLAAPLAAVAFAGVAAVVALCVIHRRENH